MMLVAASSLGGKENRQVPRQALPARPDQRSPQPFVVSPGDIHRRAGESPVTPRRGCSRRPALINPVGAAARQAHARRFHHQTGRWWTSAQIGSTGDYRVRIMDARADGDAHRQRRSKRFKEETTTRPRPQSARSDCARRSGD